MKAAIPPSWQAHFRPTGTESYGPSQNAAGSDSSDNTARTAAAARGRDGDEARVDVTLFTALVRPSDTSRVTDAAIDSGAARNASAARPKGNPLSLSTVATNATMMKTHIALAIAARISPVLRT